MQPYGGGDQLFQRREKERMFQIYEDELRQSASKIVSSVKAFYIAERRSLLNIQVLLLGILSCSPQPALPQSANIVKQKLVCRDMPANLAKGLLRCQERGEFSRFADGEANGQSSRQNLAISIQEQKIQHLKLLFSIFYREADVSKNNDSLVASMTDYLLRSCTIDDQAYRMYAHLP